MLSMLIIRPVGLHPIKSIKKVTREIPYQDDKGLEEEEEEKERDPWDSFLVFFLKVFVTVITMHRFELPYTLYLYIQYTDPYR